MAGPAPEALTDIPPAARDAVSALTATPSEPVKILVSGGIGTGKSSVLAMVRSALRSANVPVMTRAPRAGDDPGAAIVIDDAHLLADEELDQLAERVSDPGSTLVVATEPLTQQPALRALTTALERENPAISLGSLTPPEVTEAAALAIGAQPPTEVVRALMVSTAGLPFLLRPAIAAAVSPNGESAANAIVQAARYALIERLRRVEEPVLDTLLVSSLSPELGPDDVAAALRAQCRRCPAVGRPRPRQRTDRAFTQPGISPGGPSRHRCDHRRCKAPRHRDSPTLLSDRIDDAFIGSRAEDGRPRPARRSAR